MFHLAIKNLLQERLRLLVSAGGVGAALVLVLFLEGVFAASRDQLVAYVENTDAEVWVMQQGVSNMHMATTVVPVALETDLERVPGVESATPILYVSNFVQAGAKRRFAYIVGLPPGSARGGAWDRAAGKADPGLGEAVVPRILAQQAGLQMGDSVDVLGRSLRIAGTSNGTFSMANSVAFVAFGDLQELLGIPGSASYFLVKAKPGVPPAALAARIVDTVPGVNAITKEAFAANDREMSRQMGVDIIQVISLIGLIVGALVVAFTMYSATVRRAREYGVARALGAKTRHLLVLIGLQTMLITALSFGIAIGLAFVAKPLVAAFVPEVPLAYPPESLLRIGVIGLGIAALAAALPAYRVSRVDPAVVFRE